MQLKGFWSYVHKDDEIEKGRISSLAHDVAGQFQLNIGEQLEFFFDKDDIKWGEDWQHKIDENLSTIACFVPIITPLYFRSKECRRELQYFISRAKDLGITELLLPIYYVTIPEIEQQETTDDLIKTTRSYQWEDWRDLRFHPVDSESYRRGVARLASRLIDANKRVENHQLGDELCRDDLQAKVEDEDLGFIDKLALTEETLTSLPVTLNQIAQEIQTIGELMKQSTEEMQQDSLVGSGFSARVVTARKLASRLEEPVDRIVNLSNTYSSQLLRTDSGIRLMIERSPEEIRSSPESKENICKFLLSIRSLYTASSESVKLFEMMIDASRPLEDLSRDLRPVIRKLSKGITILIEATGIIGNWMSLLDQTEIDCSTE